MITTEAAVAHAPGEAMTIETVELADPRGDEVLVRVEASGICHTDVGAQSITPLPAVLGHEGTGVVEEVGERVTEVAVGDTVIVTYPSCGRCRQCTGGEAYICDDAYPLAFGGSRADGSTTIVRDGVAIASAFFQQSSFARHLVAPARSLTVVDPSIAPEMRAALACGLITGAGAVVNTLGVSATASFGVFGAGAVGLSALMMARTLGASPLVAVDVNADRLALAAELGATHIFDATASDVAAEIQAACGGGLGFTLETSGDEQALEAAITVLNMGGTCGMVTTPHRGEKYPFSPSLLMQRAASLRGIIQGSSIPRLFLPRLLALHDEGRFPYDRLVRTYPFAEINTAFADSAAGTTIKPVLLLQ